MCGNDIDVCIVDYAIFLLHMADKQRRKRHNVDRRINGETHSSFEYVS